MPRSEAQRLQDMREACERIAGFMKDVATHQYHGIMLDLVWETASVSVPQLLRSLQSVR